MKSTTCMRRTTLGTLGMMLLLGCPATMAAEKDPFAEWKPLLGQWDAVGGGAPGAGVGGFSFAPDLGGKILVRRNHSDYPATKDTPATTHEDLMIVYAEAGAVRAAYFDNEGHVIRYGATPGDNRMVLLSEPGPGPRFRLTYDWSTAADLHILFEISPPGPTEKFTKYVEGTAHRKK